MFRKGRGGVKSDQNCAAHRLYPPTDVLRRLHCVVLSVPPSGATSSVNLRLTSGLRYQALRKVEQYRPNGAALAPDLGTAAQILRIF